MWSGDPPLVPEVVGGRSRRYGSDRGTLLEVWMWSGDTFRGPEVVGGPFRRYGGGRRTLPKV